jgi:hypothetical protein
MQMLGNVTTGIMQVVMDMVRLTVYRVNLVLGATVDQTMTFENLVVI